MKKNKLSLDEQFKIAQEYLKERIKVKNVLRKKSASKSFEEKLKDIIELQKFFGRKPWKI